MMKLGAKKLSSKDDFEGVYLKANSSRKAFAKLSKKDVEEALSSPDLKRCVNHCALNTFKKNRESLLRHGFDHEDIHSMCNVYALTFVALPNLPETRKDFSYLLMHYLQQRLHLFCMTFDRKFKANEICPEVHIEDLIYQTGEDNYLSVWESIATPTQECEPEDKAEVLEQLREDYETQKLWIKNLNVMFKNCKKSKYIKVKKLEEIKATIRITERSRNRYLLKIKEIEKAFSVEYQSSKSTSQLRGKVTKIQLKELKINPDKYRDILAYFATTRLVDYVTRRKARNFCDKSDINYIEWAKDQIFNQGKDKNYFVY